MALIPYPEGIFHSNLTLIVFTHMLKDEYKSGGNICKIEVMVNNNITTYIPHIWYNWPFSTKNYGYHGQNILSHISINHRSTQKIRWWLCIDHIQLIIHGWFIPSYISVILDIFIIMDKIHFSLIYLIWCFIITHKNIEP